MNNQQAIKSLIIAPIIALLVGIAGSQYGQSLYGWPLYAMGVALAFLINWGMFVPAKILQTEKFFDLTGSLTYITVTLMALYFSENLDLRSHLLGAMVIIWAVRLGTFLFNRILQDGKDDRFDKIIPNTLRFFNVWTLQALWVSLTAAAALIAITSNQRKALGVFAFIGLAVWLIGFLIEVVADNQKRQFKKDPKNKGRFIQTGLWAHSRHPNYFGEIMLWTGVFIVAAPVLQGWQWVAIISPIFVYLLLTKISGVPGLEAKAEQKWGGEADYEAYKSSTPVLVPKLG